MRRKKNRHKKTQKKKHPPMQSVLADNSNKQTTPDLSTFTPNKPPPIITKLSPKLKNRSRTASTISSSGSTCSFVSSNEFEASSTPDIQKVVEDAPTAEELTKMENQRLLAVYNAKAEKFRSKKKRPHIFQLGNCRDIRTTIDGLVTKAETFLNKVNEQRAKIRDNSYGKAYFLGINFENKVTVLDEYLEEFEQNVYSLKLQANKIQRLNNELEEILNTTNVCIESKKIVHAKFILRVIHLKSIYLLSEDKDMFSIVRQALNERETSRNRKRIEHYKDFISFNTYLETIKFYVKQMLPKDSIYRTQIKQKFATEGDVKVKKFTYHVSDEFTSITTNAKIDLAIIGPLMHISNRENFFDYLKKINAKAATGDTTSNQDKRIDKYLNILAYIKKYSMNSFKWLSIYGMALASTTKCLHEFATEIVDTSDFEERNAMSTTIYEERLYKLAAKKISLFLEQIEYIAKSCAEKNQTLITKDFFDQSKRMISDEKIDSFYSYVGLYEHRKTLTTEEVRRFDVGFEKLEKLIIDYLGIDMHELCLKDLIDTLPAFFKYLSQMGGELSIINPQVNVFETGITLYASEGIFHLVFDGFTKGTPLLERKISQLSTSNLRELIIHNMQTTVQDYKVHAQNTELRLTCS